MKTSRLSLQRAERDHDGEGQNEARQVFAAEHHNIALEREIQASRTARTESLRAARVQSKNRDKNSRREREREREDAAGLL